VISRDAVWMLYRAWHYRWKLDRVKIRFMRRQLARGDTAADIGALR
jgi:hypothetical protein